MLNNKIIGLFVLGLALSSPLRNANALASPGASSSELTCWETDGCKDGYTLSADGTKCISNCATGTYADKSVCDAENFNAPCELNSNTGCYSPNCQGPYVFRLMGACNYLHKGSSGSYGNDYGVSINNKDASGCGFCGYPVDSCEDVNANYHTLSATQASAYGCATSYDLYLNGTKTKCYTDCTKTPQYCEYSSIEDCESKNNFAICEEVSGSHIGGGDDGFYVCPEVTGCQEGMGLNSMGDCEPVQAKTCETTDTGSAYMKYATGMSCPSGFGFGDPMQIDGMTCTACCKHGGRLTCENSNPGFNCKQIGNTMCYEPSTCKDGYTLSNDGKCVAAGNACNPSTYDAFLSALSNSNCTTVTLAATIDGQDDSNAANLEVPANKVINGNGKTLKMSRTLSLGGSTNIKNLTLINHTRDAIYIASGGDTLNGVNIETESVGININRPYMMSGNNTIKVYGSNAVGISAPNNSSILSMLSGTLDINASNGATGIQLSNEYSEIVVESGALNINIMDGYAIASTGGRLNIDGTLNIDHDGPQSPVYGTSSTLTIEGEGDINIVTNSIADTINVASLEVLLEGTLNIEAPIANGAYFIKSANGSFYFYSGDSELITKSTGSRTFSSTDVGLKINVVETSPNAIWHVIGSGYSNRWEAYNNLNCMSGYNKTYPTNSCWLNTSLSTDPA